MPNAYMVLFLKFLEDLRALECDGTSRQDSVDRMIALLIAERRTLQVNTTSREDEDTLDELPTVSRSDRVFRKSKSGFRVKTSAK